MVLDSSTTAKSFGLIVCSIFIMDTNLYAFKETVLQYFYQSQSVAEDQFPRHLRVATDTLLSVIWYN